MESNWRIAELIKKRIQEDLTGEERLELEAWISESAANRQFADRFDDKDYVARELELMSHADTDASLGRTLDMLGIEKKEPSRLGWMKYAVAAAVLLALGTGTYFWLTTRHADNTIAKTPAAPKDVPAGGDRAVLTLSDGSKVLLDSAANGTLAQQGQVKVIKQDGQLKYSAGGNDINGHVDYNIVSTPRGGKYQLVLEDGSQVWLNAASTLKYPTVFAGKERKVELIGEGYFEVAHSKTPFKVVVPGGQEVEVLGTHFNIMAYKDEEAMRTTLLQGAVKVTAGTAAVVIKPGEQSIVSYKSSQSHPIQVQTNADTEQAVAWKNGFQSFKNADLPTIMRQVSRWYDVDIKYTGSIPSMGGLNATIPRTISLQHLLQALELNNDQLHFKLADGTVTVLQ